MTSPGTTLEPGRPGGGFLRELAAFLDFLRHLWGILAGVSVLFPLSNTLLKVIPLGDYHAGTGVFDQIAPPVTTTLSTVVTLFVVLTTFEGRRRARGAPGRRAALRHAWWSFAAGLAALLGYLALHQVYAMSAWDPWGWGSGDPRKLFAEVPLTLLYAALFALLTRAFMLLGLLEFVRDGTEGLTAAGRRDGDQRRAT
jgi:hypothetical protein